MPPFPEIYRPVFDYRFPYPIVPADPLYQQLLLTAEKTFWR